MRRVLHVFLPPDGGVAEHVRALAEHLPAGGWTVDLAGPPEAAIYASLAAVGTAIHPLPFVRGLGAPGAEVRVLRRLVALVRRGHYDVVHSHDTKGGLHGRLAARLAGVPSVHTPHSLAFVGDITPSRRALAHALELGLRPFTGALICVCEDERRLALRYRLAPRRRVHMVYNGCERCPDTPAPDAALVGLRERGPLAAVVSVLREQKTVDVFLDAAPLILQRVPEARLAVVGNGRLRDQLVARAERLGLMDDERFAFLPFEAPASRYLRTLDVFVLPSSWEAFPISLLEALACGVPQVATDVGGTREAVTSDTGLLVPPGDSVAMAEAVAVLLADAGRRSALAETSRARHSAHFTVERMVRETTAVYDGLLTESHR